MITKAKENVENLKPVSSQDVLDQSFLEARSKLLDIAAILDRIGRGHPDTHLKKDHRMLKIRKALEILLEAEPASAERIQQIFSLPYDPKWEVPQPR